MKENTVCLPLDRYEKLLEMETAFLNGMDYSIELISDSCGVSRLVKTNNDLIEELSNEVKELRSEIRTKDDYASQQIANYDLLHNSKRTEVNSLKSKISDALCFLEDINFPFFSSKVKLNYSEVQNLIKKLKS